MKPRSFPDGNSIDVDRDSEGSLGKLTRGWFLRLSKWGKSEYRAAYGSWCETHRQYLSDCQHFREWLVETDNDRKDG